MEVVEEGDYIPKTGGRGKTYLVLAISQSYYTSTLSHSTAPITKYLWGWGVGGETGIGNIQSQPASPPLSYPKEKEIVIINNNNNNNNKMIA